MKMSSTGKKASSSSNETVLLEKICGVSGKVAMLLRYCRNVHPTWVKFNSKDTKESE